MIDRPKFIGLRCFDLRRFAPWWCSDPLKGGWAGQTSLHDHCSSSPNLIDCFRTPPRNSISSMTLRHYTSSDQRFLSEPSKFQEIFSQMATIYIFLPVYILYPRLSFFFSVYLSSFFSFSRARSRTTNLMARSSLKTLSVRLDLAILSLPNLSNPNHNAHQR